MNRRGFLKGILAAATAPYVVTAAGVLMPVKKIIVPRGEWSLDGLQWTEDEIQLFKERAAPPYLFHRFWIKRAEMAELYPELLYGRAGGANFAAASS